jgi:hypothetical protein
MAAEKTDYDGLAIEDIVPVAWEDADFSHSALLEHANDETARALQAIAVYEEAPRSPTDDLIHMPSDSSRLEAKIDLLLSLVSKVVSERVGAPDSSAMILRNSSIEWQIGLMQVSRGASGIISIWMNPHIPLPLRLPCRIDNVIERNGHAWAQARFEYLAHNVSDGLGQVIFRHHRRQVAIARGTIVVGKRDAAQRQ